MDKKEKRKEKSYEKEPHIEHLEIRQTFWFNRISKY